MSGYFQSISTSSNVGSTQALTTFPASQEEKAKLRKPISYAETTKVFVDETTRETLKSYGVKKISSWAGRNLQNIISGKVKSIPVFDARIINLKAGSEIIKLKAEIIDRFTIDPVIRSRLERINLRELRPHASELYEFRTGGTRTITKERAEKYNDLLKRMNGLQQAKIFDPERIFQLALAESISENERKLSEHTWITIGDNHRKELNDLPDKNEISKCVGKKFANFYREVKTISVKDAVLIHKISGKIIFTFNKEALEKIPLLPAHLNELESLIQKFKEEGKTVDGEVRKKITYFKKTDQKCIDSESAEKINSCFGKELFDFASILAQAVQEAEDEVKEMQFSSLPKKRPRTGDSSVPSAKKQRTGEATDQPRMAIVLDDEMPSVRGESGGQPNNSQPLSTAPDKPAELAPKSKHDLRFLLN